MKSQPYLIKIMKDFSKTWLFQLLKLPDKDSFLISMLMPEEVCSMLVLLVLVRQQSLRITSPLLIKMLLLMPPLTSITTLTPNLFKLLLNPKLTREPEELSDHHQAKLSSISWMISTCHSLINMELKHQSASSDKLSTMVSFMTETILKRRNTLSMLCSLHARIQSLVLSTLICVWQDISPWFHALQPKKKS